MATWTSTISIRSWHCWVEADHRIPTAARASHQTRAVHTEYSIRGSSSVNGRLSVPNGQAEMQTGVLVHRTLRHVGASVTPCPASCFILPSVYPGRRYVSKPIPAQNPLTARLCTVCQVGHAQRHRPGPVRRHLHLSLRNTPSFLLHNDLRLSRDATRSPMMVPHRTRTEGATWPSCAFSLP